MPGHKFAPANMAGQQGFEFLQPSYVVSPYAMLDIDELYRISDYGRRVADELDKRRAALAEENVELTVLLEQEEELLGRLAASLSDHEFTILSGAFDAKVGELRQQQDLKAELLQDWLDQEARFFEGFVRQFVRSVAEREGYLFVMNSDTVFHADDDVDITEPIHHELRSVLGDGTASWNYESPAQYISRGVYKTRKQVLSEQ